MKNFIKNPAKYKYLFLAAFLGSMAVSNSVQASISSIMIDADSGKILSQYNADERRFPASLTKLMTLYLTFEALEKGQLRLSDKLTVSRRAANMEPSKLGLRAGQKIDVRTVVNAKLNLFIFIFSLLNEKNLILLFMGINDNFMSYRYHHPNRCRCHRCYLQE